MIICILRRCCLGTVRGTPLLASWIRHPCDGGVPRPNAMAREAVAAAVAAALLAQRFAGEQLLGSPPFLPKF